MQQFMEHTPDMLKRKQEAAQLQMEKMQAQIAAEQPAETNIPSTPDLSTDSTPASISTDQVTTDSVEVASLDTNNDVTLPKS